MAYPDSKVPWLNSLNEYLPVQHQLTHSLRTRDEITSLWLTILSYTFPTTQNYRIQLHTWGPTEAVLEVWHHRLMGRDTWGAECKVQVLIIQPSVRELDEGNFERVIWGDQEPREGSRLILTKGVEVMKVERVVLAGGKVGEFVDERMGKEHEERGKVAEEKLPEWLSLRDEEGRVWVSRLLDGLKRMNERRNC
jgi:hypothetical protein